MYPAAELPKNQQLIVKVYTVPPFLQERRITPHGAVREAFAGGSRANERTAPIPAKTSPSPDESSMSPLDKRREELERGASGDRDLPYRFTLPTALPQVLAWVKLLARVQQGDFQPEVGAIGSGNSSTGTPLGPSTPPYASYGKNLARCADASTRSER